MEIVIISTIFFYGHKDDFLQLAFYYCKKCGFMVVAMYHFCEVTRKSLPTHLVCSIRVYYVYSMQYRLQLIATPNKECPPFTSYPSIYINDENCNCFNNFFLRPQG